MKDIKEGMEFQKGMERERMGGGGRGGDDLILWKYSIVWYIDSLMVVVWFNS